MSSAPTAPLVVPFPAGAPSLAQELPAGRLIELSGTRGAARVTVAASAVWQAQIEGETTAWIQPAGGSLYPPDLHECGIDLGALAVIHVPGSPSDHGLLRAAELLLHSGAFGLVVVDLRDSLPRSGAAWQGRLLGLAREHRSRILFLTSKMQSVDSLGPLVSLRIEPRRLRASEAAFTIEPEVLKNKQGLVLHDVHEPRRGPWGLR
jgi:recombination protein RecA